MATLRELIIKISANSSSFQSEIARASRMGSDYYRVMQNGGRQAALAAKESENALKDLTSGFATAGRAATAAAAAFATGELIKVADEWNSVNARLKQASQSSNDFAVAQSKLMRISQSTGTAFSDNANLFARSAASMREFGYSTQDVLKVTEAISTGLKLSGANTQEASSVITQFSQALAQGVLRGEEFNAVNESGDRVIRALAAGMGVARKDLKAMADAGKLTIDQVVPAIISQLGTMQNEFAAMPQTVSSSIQRVSNSFMAWVGGVNEATGATDTLSGGINGIAGLLDSLSSSAVSGALNDVADNMSTLTTVAGALVGVGLAKYFGGVVSGAASSTGALISAAKAEVSLAAATTKSAQAAVTASRADVYRAQQALQQSKSSISQAAQEEKVAAAKAKVTLAQTRLTAALASGTATEKLRAQTALERAQAALVSAKNADAQAVAEKRLAAAQATLNRNIANRSAAQQNLNSVTSIGTRMMSGALGLIGGVPGLVMLGAGAWYAMYQNQEQARKSAQEYARTITEVRQATASMSLTDASDNEQKTKSSLQEQNRLVELQAEKVAKLSNEVKGYRQMLADPGLTIGSYMVNHLTSIQDATEGLDAATSALATEQERLAQMQAKSSEIQAVLEGLEHRRVTLIRQQAAEQNSAYQSLLLMNGQHSEFNRLMSAGNTLLAARQGLGTIPLRIPNAKLTDKQTELLEKSDQQLELSGLKGSARAKRQAEFAADAAGLTNTPEYSDARNRYISNEVARFEKDEAAKPQKKGPKTEGEKTEDVYKRLIKQQQEQIALAGKNTELAKMKYQVTQGDFASLEKSKKETLLQNAVLIDQKNISEQLKTFRDGLADSNATARERGDIDFLGAGQGDKARDRMKEMADIRTDFLKQQRDLQRDFSRGEISEDLYKEQTRALKEALDDRLEIQADYYKRLDEQRSDWQSGVSDSLANYADEATNYAQIAADATSSILDSATNEVVEGFKGMIDGSKSASEALSDAFAGFGETVIDTLLKMGAQWLVYQAVQLMVGKSAQASAAAGVIANAQASSLMAQLNAFASTAAIPIVGPAMAPAAMAAAAAITTPLVAGISAVSLAGMAHDGIDRVPETGTWLLQKGERVVTASTSAKLDATLEKVRESRSSGSGVRDVNISYQLTGKPDDTMLIAMDAHGKKLARDIKTELAKEVISPQGMFGNALKSRYVRGYKE